MYFFMLIEKIIKFVNVFEILILIICVYVWFVYYNVYCLLIELDCFFLFWSLNYKCFFDICFGY